MMYVNASGERLSHRALQAHTKTSFPRGRPPTGWAVDRPEISLTQRRDRQAARVRQDAEASYTAPVTDANGVTWNGGFDSALKIKAAIDMAEFAGLSQLALYDLANDEHVVTLAEGRQVAATVGAVFQEKLAAKQAALRALADIDLEAPDARDQIAAVTLAGYYQS